MKIATAKLYSSKDFKEICLDILKNNIKSAYVVYMNNKTTIVISYSFYI